MRKITIEGLLAWAFTQELPKIGAGAGSSMVASSNWMADIAALGTMIDRNPNPYGAIPGYIYEGEPAADAILVGEAVRQLDRHNGFEIAEGWYPFPDWRDEQGLVRTEVDKIAQEQRERGDHLSGKHVVNLVISAAKLGRGPVWQADEPRTELCRGSNGKDLWFVTRSARDRMGNRYTFEDNGFDVKRGKVMKGAFRKYRLEHSVRGAVLSRLDWQLWQSALESLHDALRQTLSAHCLLDFHPDRHPWNRAKTGGKNHVSQ